MSLGGDDVRPFTPVAAVASQFVLSAKRGDDPGDAARVLMYPGELARGLWQRAVCATSKSSPSDRCDKPWPPPWKDSVDTDELKTYFRRVSKVFGSKITHVIAGSFFSVGAALLALVRGDTATLGLFSCVMIGYPIMTTRGTGVQPLWGLVPFLALVYMTTSITSQRQAAAARRRAKLRAKEGKAPSVATTGEGEAKKER